MNDDGVRREPRPEARSSRDPLSIAQIIELDVALLEAFKALHELRERYRAAMHIKFPPLPPVFSESIVIVAAAKLFGPGWRARYGGPTCDVLLFGTAAEKSSSRSLRTPADTSQALAALTLCGSNESRA